MMKLNKIFIFFISALICFISSQLFSLEISLDDYIKKALDTSTEIKNYKDQKEIAKKEYLNTVYQSYIPDVYYTLSSNLYSDTKKFSINDDETSSSLNLSYNLFNNFKDKFTVDFQFIDIAIAEANLWLNVQDTIYNAISRYADLLKNKKMIEVSRSNMESYLDQYEKTKIYYSQGLKSYSDLLKSELNYKDSELFYTQNENLEINSLINFNIAIKDDPVSAKNPLEIVFDESQGIAGIDESIEKGLKNRKEIYIKEKEIEKKEKELKKSYATLYPDTKLDFSYAKNKIFSIGSGEKTYAMSFSLSFPITSGIYTKDKNYYEANIYLAETRRDLDDLKLSIKKEIISAIYQFSYAKKSYEVSKIKAKISNDNLEITKQKYYEGNASVIDLVDAQKDQLNSQTDLANSYYDLYLAMVYYKKVIGEELWKGEGI
jgi:outer membrane protein